MRKFKATHILYLGDNDRILLQAFGDGTGITSYYNEKDEPLLVHDDDGFMLSCGCNPDTKYKSWSLLKVSDKQVR